MNSNPASDRESQLYEQLAVLLDVADDLDAPKVEALIARFPEFSEDIRDFFAGRSQLSEIVAPLRQSGSWRHDTAGASLSETDDGGPRQMPELPNYEVIREISRGGMGIVYEARQLSLDRVVALKMIKSAGPTSIAQIRRFHREAKRVAQLEHPHIVPVFEVGEHDGCHYFTMRVMTGGTYSERLRSARPAPRAGVEIVSTLAKAVHFAHQRGILHRDIKPGNILFDEAGVAQIGDFGLSSELIEGTAADGSVVLAGTPLYMAPEQAANEPELTTAVDVYGLGVVLYESLTGRPPFEADDLLNTLLDIKHRSPTAPRRVNPRIDADLNTICLKCLEKDPSRRYGSAEALADDLNRWLRNEPILARRVSALERATKWVRRSPAMAALSVLSTLAVIGFIAALIVANVFIARERDEKSSALQERSIALLELEATLGREQRLSYFQTIALAERDLWAGDVDQSLAALGATPEELRGWEWHYLTRQAAGSVQSYHIPDDPTCLAVRAAGGAVFAAGGLPGSHGSIHVLHGRHGSEIMRLDVPLNDAVTALEPSPNGRRLLVVTRDGHITLVTVDRTHATTLATSSTAVWDIAFSPDGSRVAYAGDTGEIHILNASTGAELHRFGDSATPVWSLAFHPDGKRVAAGNATGDIQLWEIASGAASTPLMGHSQLVRTIAFNTKGNRLVSASVDGTAIVWDVEAGTPLETLRGHSGFATGASFSHDDTRIVTSGVDGTVRLWDSQTWEPLAVHRGHTGSVWNVAFDGDDRYVLSVGADGTLRRWDGTVNGLDHALDQSARWIRGIEASKNGQTIAVRLREGVVEIWDVKSDLRLCELSERYRNESRIVLSGDGRMVLGYKFGVARLHDVKTGTVVGQMPSPMQHVDTMAISYDGQLVAFPDGPDMVVWDVAHDREQRRVTLPSECSFIAFDHQTTRVAVITNGDDAGTRRLHVIALGDESPTIVHCVGNRLVFSQTGDRVATFGESGRVQVWNLRSGELAAEINSRHGNIRAAAFSTSDRVFCATDNGTVTVWELAEAREVLTLRDAPGEIDTLLVEDDQTLLGLGKNGVARRWKIKDSFDNENGTSTRSGG